MKRGIIQSRGLGDILIALPIALNYKNQGDEIYWPICEEFLPSFKTNVPWVNWLPIVTDNVGKFFLDEPLRILKENGVEIDDCLYLYQFLNSKPEFTDPELFNILKFDQYKYWVSNIPFIEKWNLTKCITRDHAREETFKKSLNINGKYAVVHLRGSNFHANIDLSWLGDIQIIDIDDHLSDNLWDWLSVLEGAESFVGVDSVFANLVDQMQLSIPKKYWIRRSPWDLTPVLGTQWMILSTDLPITEAQRVDVIALQQKKENQLKTHLAFAPTQQMPTSFMDKLGNSSSLNNGLDLNVTFKKK